MQLGKRCCLAAMVAAAPIIARAEAESPTVDTEFSVTVERGDAPSRVWVRFHSKSRPNELALCFSSVNWELRHSDGSTDGGGAPFTQGIARSRCSLADNWTLVRPGESTFLLLELSPVQPGDHLQLRAFVQVGPRDDFLHQSKLGFYSWQGKLDDLVESRGGPTRG
jgi:hypothetical protein